MNDKVNFIDIIEKYDISTEPFSEHEISDNLGNVDKDNSKNLEYEWLPEVMAFDFTENYSNDETGWGTYYGPLMVIPNQDGTVTETPSIKNITDEIIAYWIKRAYKAKNPILKTRYADLVWDFSKIVTGTQCDYKYACMVIDNTIEIAEKDLYKYDIFVITKLERAISLALALNDDARLRKLTETIIKYEQKIQEDDKSGTWGFAYRILVKNKKVKLPQDLENKIIGDLEKRWQRLNQAESKNPFAIETLSLDLADYYRRNNKNGDLRRVVISIGEAYKGVSKKAEPLLTSSWLQKVHAIYSQFGFNSEAQEITRIISELGPKTRDSLKEISHEVKIAKEEIDKYIEETIDGDLETVLTKIAIRFIPSKSEAERELIELSKKSVMKFLFNKALLDDKGRKVATVGPLHNDLEGNIISQMSTTISFYSILLNYVIDALIDRFKPDDIVIIEHLYKSPSFIDDKKDLISLCIKRMLNNDILEFIHMIVPQIEDSFRHILNISGGYVLKSTRYGGFNYKSFDEILRDPIMTNIFGEDAITYFRILYTDPRGMNLRNDVCHGIISMKSLNKNIMNRLFHSLLCLALLRKKK